MSDLALAKIRENKRTRAKSLKLARCGLYELPDELFDCVWLEELILSNRIWDDQQRKWIDQASSGPYNLLRELPKEFEKLKKLKRLYAGGSEDIHVLGYLVFSDNWGISDLSALTGLSQLQRLDLRNTKVSDLSALTGLSQLQTLDLSRTGVSDLSALTGLSQLQKLDLQKTHITNLSSLIPLIERGVPVRWREKDYRPPRIVLYDTPLTHPPVEVVKEGNQAILNYFRELEAGEVIVHEAKFLILGEAGTGKTTLARRVCDHQAPMPEETKDTTRGIDIVPHTWCQPDQPDFLMNIWDFGGQDVYHGIHQLFLSKRALYALVLDGRIEENPHYWLQAQELLGQDSPLLVILNKKGSIRQNAPVHEWRGEYGNLKEYKEINLQDDQDQLKLLSQTVETYIRTLPHIQRGERLPKKWVAIRDRLKEEQKKKKYIWLDRFQDICEEEGIAEEERQDFLSDYLHDLGAILHFSDEPQLKRILFLDAEWAIDAIYNVLDHTREQERTGYFSREDLKQLWKESSYRRVFDELLALMQISGFELCFEVPKEDLFIVPQLLPADKPEGYAWQAGDQELALRYAYDFMPKGIVPRLVVRLHAHLADEGMLWKRGAVFIREGATAEVVEHFRDNYIHIRVKGQNRRRLLTIIAFQLDQINATFHFSERMNVHQLIPCNCRECRRDKPYYFRKANLDNAKRRGVREVQCQHSFDNISVISLLEETFYQDNTYKSYSSNPTYMQRYEYIRQLLMDNQLQAAIQELDEGLRGSHHSNTVAGLMGRYNGLKNEIMGGTISSDERARRTNVLLQTALDLAEKLQQEYPGRAQYEVQARNPVPDPVTTRRAGEEPASKGGSTIIINGNVGSFSSENQGTITNHIDQSQHTTTTNITNHLTQIQQLVEAEKAAGYIDEDAYEELLDILEEIKENPEPQTDRQQRKWKRWLGKAVEAGGKFVGGRLEKGADALIGEGLKGWLKEGGLEVLGSFLQGLG